jgi:hypothetical protein
MGIRTPDLFHAIQRQHVHRRPYPQVTVPGRPRQSPGIQAGCCTFLLYSSDRLLAGLPVLALAGQHMAGQLRTRIVQAGPGALASRWSAVHNSHPRTSASAT